MTIREFVANIQFVWKPSFWMMSQPFSKGWDDELNDLLNHNKFTNAYYFDDKVERCSVMLGYCRIWVENYPYDSFMPEHAEFRASRLTILRARKALLKDIPERFN